MSDKYPQNMNKQKTKKYTENFTYKPLSFKEILY